MKIHVNITSGPIGSCGFRTGRWSFTVDGRPGTIYASIPHGCDLAEQREILLSRIRAAIESHRVTWGL